MVIAGPTAVGKTALSLQMPSDLFEVISFDSVQIYRYLNIGSGKPTEDERRKIYHHGIDIADPDEDFTAGDFVRYAEGAYASVISKHHKPIFVGGTGFYLDAFFYGLSEIPDIPSDVRDSITAELKEQGVQAMYAKLVSVDPIYATRIHANDKNRIIRGLEVMYATGKPISSYYVGKQGHEPKGTIYIGVYAERDDLLKRISDRVDFMMNAGFIDEVKGLRTMGYNQNLKSMKSIGYLEINMYLDGLLNKTEAIEKIKTQTAHYAKRQMTWFSRNKKFNWFNAKEINSAIQFIQDRMTDG